MQRCNRNNSNNYYLINKDKVNKRTKEYYFNNIEYFRAYQKEYSKVYFSTEKGRTIKRIVDQKRRTQKKGLEYDGSVTQYALDNLIKSQDCKCIYCSKDISDIKERHLDHIIPLAKGGIHSITNLQWLCILCNLRKNALTEQEFINNLWRYGIELKTT